MLISSSAQKDSCGNGRIVNRIVFPGAFMAKGVVQQLIKDKTQSVVIEVGQAQRLHQAAIESNAITIQHIKTRRRRDLSLMRPTAGTEQQQQQTQHEARPTSTGP